MNTTTFYFTRISSLTAYDVWVGQKWAGRASTHEEAERVASRHIALDETIKRQNQAVLAAYTC